jgi:GT2 family glycosyltransferase
MAVSRAAIAQAGLLDEALFLYTEDAEWCIRIHEAGFAIVFVPAAKAWHVGSAATGGLMSPASIYYDTRNMIVVAERHHRLPRGARALRRGVIVGAHLLTARGVAGVRSVLAGWHDARRGRLGPR